MDRFQFAEKLEKCECDSCGQEFNVDDLEYTIGDLNFCDRDCACDYIADNVEDFVDKICD